jgi:hypothetical protein
MNRILLPSMKQCAAGLILKTGLLILLASTSGFATSFTVNVASNDIGELPWIITAFATSSSGGLVYPVDATDLYYFSLYDTGADKVYMPSGMEGVANNNYNYLRMNGLSTIDTNTLFAPIYSGWQAEVGPITPVTPGSNPPDKILIGGPVTGVTSALIDYTNLIYRTGYPQNVGFGGWFEGVDITLYPDSAANPFKDSVTVGLFKDPNYDGYRPFMSDVTLIKGNLSVISAPDAAAADTKSTGIGFLYDTGTTVTILKESVANSLGFHETAATTDLTPNWVLDSITMTGPDGTATFTNVPVVVRKDDPQYWTAGVDVIIGSNLFSDHIGTGIKTEVLFNGPGNVLYINAPSESAPIPEPSTWILLMSGLVGMGYLARRRKGV